VSAERSWLALVTFERQAETQEVLPEWAHGACGWMIALGPDFQTASQRLVRDLEHNGLRVLEVADECEVFSPEDVDETDEHLANNWREIEADKQTVWGTLHGYKGEGEA
jgi:hypothetical protein